MGLLSQTHIYLIKFLTLQNINPQTNGKNDKRVWWQGEVRFEGCYDEAREKRRQEGGEDGEERCLSKDEKEVAKTFRFWKLAQVLRLWSFFCLIFCTQSTKHAKSVQLVYKYSCFVFLYNSITY